MAGPFQTPQNEKSFSGLCDQVILDTGRAGSLLSVVQYANATLQECHALALFHADLIEEQVAATATPFIWQYELSDYRLKKLRTCQYDTCKIYPKLKMPGRIQGNNSSFNSDPYYYYAADDYYVFNGVSIGEYVNIAFYQWPQKFQYHPRLGATNTAQLTGSGYTTRPAYYDLETKAWQYLNAAGTAYATTLGDPTLEETRRDNAMNWMLKKWYELIQEGTKNKIFNLFGDTRASGSYSLYKSMQKDLVNNSQFESEGF